MKLIFQKVDAILDHRRCKGISYYLVHWEGFPDSNNSWQSTNNLNCTQLINEYHSKADEEFVKNEQLKKAAREKAKDRNNEFEVEQIVGHKTIKGIVSYKVRWLGWDAKDDTWVRETELQCPALIKAYESHKKKEENAKAKKRNLKKKFGDSDDSEDDYGKKKPKAQFFAVDRILNARINKQGTFDFFVCWKGYGFEDNSWIPEKDLDCSELVDEVISQ